MRIHALTLALTAGMALTACADIKTTSGPPIAGTSTGPGSPPLTQQARDTMGANSANASGGTATITGTRGGGDGGARPIIERSGTTGPGAGANPYSSTTEPLRVPGLGQRGGGGGS
jgi:hypothetical protein